jgi:hypothetical protein
MHKQINKRIGIEFYNRLFQHPAFKDNYKAISGAEYFLLELAKYNQTDNGDSEVSSSKIDDLFKNYDKQGNYKKYINALIDLGLLLNTSVSYRVSTEEQDGYCKRYKLTEKGLDLINSNLVEYLKNLYYDGSIRRLNQQSISSRQVMNKAYDDYVLDYISDGLKYMTFDYLLVNKVLGSIDKKSIPHSLGILTKFKEKDFKDLKYNETDGRVWNEYVALKEDVRIASKYKDMVRLYTVDMRACHPTFLALYLKELYYKDFINNHTIINTINNYYSFNLEPSVTTPYCSPESLQDLISELEVEVNKYNQMFTNDSIDPRQVISDSTGYPNEDCKKYLNKTINGSIRHKGILSYIKLKFPFMYEIWTNSNVKETGNGIAKNYESKLMLNPELFRLAESLNVKLTYEYDGCSLFFYEGDTQAADKAEIIKKFINGESKRLWNLDIVVKVKDVRIVNEWSTNQYLLSSSLPLAA